MLGGGEGYLNDMNTETTNFDQTTLRSDEYFKNVTTLASVVMSCGTFLKVLGFLLMILLVLSSQILILKSLILALQVQFLGTRVMVFMQHSKRT